MPVVSFVGIRRTRSNQRGEITRRNDVEGQFRNDRLFRRTDLDHAGRPVSESAENVRGLGSAEGNDRIGLRDDRLPPIAP